MNYNWIIVIILLISSGFLYMHKNMIDRLLTYPQRGEVQVNFDVRKRVMYFSIPIFSDILGLPEEIKKYIFKRKGRAFNPHKTKFKMDSRKAYLTQEIPFSLDFQETMRGKADSFWKISQSCHKMFLEMVQEEKYKSALFIDRSSKQ